METLAVVLIVKNEAARIAQALASVTGIADEIVVLDDCSTDRTVAICEAFGATVHTRRLDDFASPETIAAGEKVIAKEIAQIRTKMPEVFETFMNYYEKTRTGERDLYF